VKNGSTLSEVIFIYYVHLRSDVSENMSGKDYIYQQFQQPFSQTLLISDRSVLILHGHHRCLVYIYIYVGPVISIMYLCLSVMQLKIKMSRIIT
jgi:hypothetical protein